MRSPRIHVSGRPHVAALLSWFIAVAYFLVSRGVQNMFPFTVLEMYSGRSEPSSSRILAIDERGGVHEVNHMDAFRCDDDITPEQSHCPDPERHYYHIDYVDRDLIDHLRSHPGTGQEPSAEPFTIVRRVWQLDAPSVSHEDCVLTHCRAVP